MKNIRTPNIDDVSRLAEIHIYGWRDAYRNIMSDELLFKQRQVMKTIKLHTRFINDIFHRVIVYDDGIIRGFAIHNDPRDSNTDGQYEISALYVEPAFQRMGIGTKLLAAIELYAKKHAISSTYVWVLDRNKKGISFYKKCGYVFDGAEKVVSIEDELREIKMVKAM